MHKKLFLVNSCAEIMLLITRSAFENSFFYKFKFFLVDTDTIKYSFSQKNKLLSKLIFTKNIYRFSLFRLTRLGVLFYYISINNCYIIL